MRGMMRPYLLAALAALAAVPTAADAGTCVTRYVPRRGDVTVCTTERGCDLYLDPGGRTVALCFVAPVDTTPFGVCTDPDLPSPYQACALTEECTVFFTSGRPPGLCL